MLQTFIPGELRIRCISGNHADLLLRLNKEDIPVHHLEEIDELTMQCSISRSDYDKMRGIASRAGAEVTILDESGARKFIKQASKRWVLMIGIILLTIATVLLPSRILFIQVEGNVLLPTEKILQNAELCGIYFGASRNEVRSEKVKNALISALPELQWVGVNTSGCVAVISVEEKTLPKESTDAFTVSSIVASTDGIIRDLTVTNGNALCQVGQAVKKGDVIISGYTDCGRVVMGSRAEGEVFADTRRAQISVSPLFNQERETITNKTKKISLQIGKKLINFYNDSGISCNTCVKMYEKEYVMLPGGFQLPIAIITETIMDCRLIDGCEEDFDWLSAAAKDYLLRQSVAGRLLAAEEQLAVENGVCTIQGNYTCYEMIGKIRNEESTLENGSNR